MTDRRRSPRSWQIWLLAMTLTPFSAVSAAVEPETAPAAPLARREATERQVAGRALHDDYAWLRDRSRPETLAYLEAENRYTEAVMAHTAPLREELYREMLGRIKETDLTVPYRYRGAYFYSRTEQGKPYPIYCRKLGSLEAPEEILLDVNRLAEGHDFFSVASFEVSPDGKRLAYAFDTDGSERYTVRVKDLTNGQLLPDEIGNASSSLAWAADNRNLFYVILDAAHRPFEVHRHELGTPAASDAKVFSESDEAFSVDVSSSKDDRFLYLSSASATTSEVRLVPSTEPLSAPRVFAPRRAGVEYSLEHNDGFFYLLSNDGAKNFQLLRVPEARLEPSAWEVIVAHREDVKLERLEIFAHHLALFQRRRGLAEVLVRDLETGQEHIVAMPEPVYAVFANTNREFDSHGLRFLYSSLITPMSTFEYDMVEHRLHLLKETEVLGGYDRSQYATERIWAKAPDGVEVPIALVYRKGLPRDGSHPCLLNGYGAYGASLDPVFSPSRLSLLDRGFVYALAQVRGGGELGKAWHEDGKLLKKKNTFSDFIAAAGHLIALGYTSKKGLAISGGSAGGLLIGAVLNQRPDLFRAALALVPFVDLMNTMLDPSLPLTVGEYEEWGNPNDAQYFDYMLSYSPYDNVGAHDYPELLVTAGLNDPRVGYWEPAKWVARLRTTKTGPERLLLRTEMEAGHAGVSGRYEALRRTAFEYAFLLDSVGAAGK